MCYSFLVYFCHFLLIFSVCFLFFFFCYLTLFMFFLVKFLSVIHDYIYIPTAYLTSDWSSPFLFYCLLYAEGQTPRWSWIFNNNKLFILFHILLFSYALFIIFLIYLFRCSPVVLELSIFGKFFYFVYVLPSYSYPAGVLSLMFPFLTHVFHEILVSFSVHIFFLYFLFLLKFGHLIPVSQSNILSYRHSSI